MYTGLLHLHNIMRWVILLLLLIAIIRHLNSRRVFSKTDNRIGLILLICADLMLVIGIYQWIKGPWGLAQIQQLGFGEVMKDSALRFWAVEHFLGMLIAIVLIHVGRAQAKRKIADFAKHKRSLVFYLISFIIILVSVPWPFRDGVGRPLLPGALD